MTMAQTAELTPKSALRLWPGVVAVVLQWLSWFVVPLVAPGAMIFGVLGGVLGGLAVVVWWAFLSWAPWSERLGAVVLMIVALVATPRFLHVSIATAGTGLLFPLYAIPVVSLAFVLWAVATRRLSDLPRRASMVVTILLGCGAWTLLRTEGVTGDYHSAFKWRWAETPEERLVASAGGEPVALAPAPAAAKAPEERPPAQAGRGPTALPSARAAQKTAEQPLPARGGNEPAALPSTPAAAETGGDWPGFRGPERNGIVRGVRIATDWSVPPPVELWRRPIRPGWSSFAVRGDLVYTQEQRGADEVVACYKLTSGEPVWRHHDAARFWESNAGAGPRATPAVSNGRVYTFGATGIVNALGARDGALAWSRNASTDTGVKVPDWGFAGSPLVVGDVVIVAAAGQLVAYDLATGVPRWFGPAHGGSYSSPHLLTIDGVAQILLISAAGATSVAPARGTLLWEHPWPTSVGIVQPALTKDGDVLINAGQGDGMRRIAVAHRPGGWTVEEWWRSIGLKPYFNDFVVHDGHAFGFDGSILACIDVEDGRRKWKGGRYGHGQLVLLPEQDLLLVVSEEGELALVGATPDQFREIARFPAIEGKTWNHPVLVGDVLLARNDRQMVAFRLAVAGR